MGLWQSRNTFPLHAPTRLHLAGKNLRLCGQAIAREGPAELSSACKKLRKSGSFFKEASIALKEDACKRTHQEAAKKQEDAKTRLKFATFFLRTAGEEFKRNQLSDFGEGLIACASEMYCCVVREFRGLNMIKVGFIMASEYLDFAIRDLTDPRYAVAKRRLRRASRAIKEIGDLEEVEKWFKR